MYPIQRSISLPALNKLDLKNSPKKILQVIKENFRRMNPYFGFNPNDSCLEIAYQTAKAFINGKKPPEDCRPPSTEKTNEIFTEIAQKDRFAVDILHPQERTQIAHQLISWLNTRENNHIFFVKMPRHAYNIIKDEEGRLFLLDNSQYIFSEIKTPRDFVHIAKSWDPVNKRTDEVSMNFITNEPENKPDPIDRPQEQSTLPDLKEALSPMDYSDQGEPFSPMDHSEEGEPLSPMDHSEEGEPLSPMDHSEEGEPLSPMNHSGQGEAIGSSPVHRKPEKKDSSNQDSLRYMNNEKAIHVADFGPIHKNWLEAFRTAVPKKPII